MKSLSSSLLAAAGAAFLLSSTSVAQENPIVDGDFAYGYDDGQWANDGECDDPRFMGPGMTDTPILEADLMHDASDCRAGVDAGTLWLVSPDNVDFGTDEGLFSNDGECDDPRFAGAGMTETSLLETDIRADATDCRTAYMAGNLTFIGGGENASSIDFGDDYGDWANDVECDDPRFAGRGMTNTPLLEADQGHDASDCRTAFEAGDLALRDAGSIADAGIDFGDDSSEWANDNECDDPRFVGDGMTATPLLDADAYHDASDCRAAFEAGDLTLRDTNTGVDFGDDDGDWANDDECDDPRFEGPGMTATPLLDDDRYHDASDCQAAYDAGTITLR